MQYNNDFVAVDTLVRVLFICSYTYYAWYKKKGADIFPQS